MYCIPITAYNYHADTLFVYNINEKCAVHNEAAALKAIFGVGERIEKIWNWVTPGK